MEVRSPRARVKLEAMVSDMTRPGLVVIDYGWGNPWDKGANINTLASDEIGDPVSGGTPNRLFLCQVERVTG